MASIRQGRVPHPYQGPLQFLLTRPDGRYFLCKAKYLISFEERTVSRFMRPFVSLIMVKESVTVRETFEEITAILAGTEVNHA